MTFLVHKISKAKWGPNINIAPDEIQADAVTTDLRTTGNTLSFWRCEARDCKTELRKTELRNTVLALASRFQRADKIDLGWIDLAEIEKIKTKTENTPGNTAVESLKSKHMDLVSLDLNRLVALAKALHTSIGQDGHFERFRSKEVVEILAQAVNDSLLELAVLNPDVQEKVQKQINKAAQASEK